jgi:deoxycytidylate deaminase
MSKQYFINKAASLATKSELGQKHAAIIVKGGNIVASGINKMESGDRKLMRLHGPKNLSVHMHAEASAIYSFLATKKGYRVLHYQKRKDATDENGYICCSPRYEN